MKYLITVTAMLLMTSSSAFAEKVNHGITSCAKDDYAKNRIFEQVGLTEKDRNENEFKTFIWLRNGAGHKVGVFTFNTDENGKFTSSDAMYLCGSTSTYNYSDLNLASIYSTIKTAGEYEITSVSLSSFENSVVHQDETLVAIQGIGVLAEDSFKTVTEKMKKTDVAVINLFIATYQIGEVDDDLASTRAGATAISSFGRFQMRLPGFLFSL